MTEELRSMLFELRGIAAEVDILLGNATIPPLLLARALVAVDRLRSDLRGIGGSLSDAMASRADGAGGVGTK